MESDTGIMDFIFICIFVYGPAILTLLGIMVIVSGIIKFIDKL